MGDPAARLAQLEAKLQALRAERAPAQPLADPAALAAATEEERLRQAQLDDAALLTMLRNLCIRYTGDRAEEVAAHAIRSKKELSHFVGNPVPRPPSANKAGSSFPIASTVWGQELATTLGAGSGFFQELCA